jgi:hypothetical protein
MAGKSDPLPCGGAEAADRQGNAPVGLDSGTATSIGSGCATLNAGFTFGFMENLFISQLHNPAARGLFQLTSMDGRFIAERCSGNLLCENAMTAGDIRPTVA